MTWHRALTASMSSAQLVLEQKLFGKRSVNKELFRDAVAVEANAPAADIRQVLETGADDVARR